MRSHGFTLVEMLVVIGAIIILLALILPALFNAKESGRAAACASNQHQLTLAFLQFAADHQGYLPGNQWDSIYQQPNTPWKRDFLLGDDVYQATAHGTALQQMMQGPQGGTIYPYLSNAPGVYRCPSYYVGAPFNSGVGSNGRYDYAAFIVFSGARVASISPKAHFHYTSGTPGGSVVGTPGTIDQSVFTPLVVEEEPNGGINGGNVEGGHCNSDRLGHAHFGGGNYSSVDGSVHRFTEPLNNNAWNWEAIAPSGKWSALGNVNWTPPGGQMQGWGWWATQ
jgi:type II secretory pathway pseudopilin PulG